MDKGDSEGPGSHAGDWGGSGVSAMREASRKVLQKAERQAMARRGWCPDCGALLIRRLDILQWQCSGEDWCKKTWSSEALADISRGGDGNAD